MYFALTHVCRHAVAIGQLAAEHARAFFERNFRPLRITKLGDRAGLLTGYYEPIVDGSRFPTGIFKIPIYRRPRDLVPPLNSTGSGFPNRGQSLRRTANGGPVPYYDRGEILDGALDGRHLEICWIKDPTDALLIQIEGSARVRLEDGTMLRINYDAHNGYPYVPISRILIERKLIPREEMSAERIREWMRANPEMSDAETDRSCFTASPDYLMKAKPSGLRAYRLHQDAPLPSTTRCMCTVPHFSSRPHCRSPMRSGLRALID